MPEEIADPVRGLVYIRGRVQGVGFRWWTRARALELGLDGYARNTDDGRVEVVAEGPREQVIHLFERLAEYPSTANRPGRVENMSKAQWSPARGVEGFAER